ncbi:MAG: hypothetical protein EKK64_04875 [Neisseriaceae bacterium]|nr:MAG: hypothetical protein EKK64_04875 [Neisseriaceae bacterium]
MYIFLISQEKKVWAKRCEFFKQYIKHRKNKPSVEWRSGKKQYYFDGDEYFITKEGCFVLEKDYQNSFAINFKGTLPSIIYPNGTKEWWANRKLHRNNGPAIEYSNGDKEWWWNGKRHNYQNPAVIIGNKQYFFEYGEFLKCIIK